MKGILALFLGCTIAVACFAAPKPAALQSPNEWTLGVIYEHPQQIMVQLPGDRKVTRYWYVILSLTNRRGREVSFYPKCELMTDRFQIIPAGTGVRNEVFKRVGLRHRGKYPFLESIEQANPRILHGRDNARDIAIIWPDFDLKAKEITLFIAGLSNETAAIEHPVKKDEQGRPVRVLLRKTLELKYKISGDPVHRSTQELTFVEKRWVMR
jgi:hypothetical protein